MNHKRAQRAFNAAAFAAMGLLVAVRFAHASPTAAQAPTLIVAPIDVKDTVTLVGNTHPSAKSALDQGLVSGAQQLGSMYIALRRSPTQERALTRFLAQQLDPSSADYHHWLQPQEFGLRYGPNDADISAVTRWLEAAGLEIHKVSQGRISIEFSGTAAQVQQAFGVEMHHYVVQGATAIANDRDPQIPRAVSPVVAGIVGLNTFPVIGAKPSGQQAAAAQKTIESRANPDLSVNYAYNYALVTPQDFATIYNVLPLRNGSTPIVGSDVKIAIVGDNDVNTEDITTFQTIFGLQQNLPTTIHVGTDPAGSSEYSTASLELAGAAAPGASLILVVPQAPAGGQTVAGLYSAITYIVDNNIAPIVEFGYSECEKTLGTDNASFNSAWQMGSAEGMSIVVAAGDYGSAGCNYAEGKYGDTGGLQVSGIASSPFVMAVGGTDFGWQWGSGHFSTYWNAPSTPVQYESAKGYIPEVPWNVTCTNALLLPNQDFLLANEVGGVPSAWPTTQDLCIANASAYPALVHSTGTGGGYSHCTALDSNGNCLASSGYSKPNWQRGTGVPADNRRDVPDVSLFASSGWLRSQGISGSQDLALPPLIPSSAILICYANAVHPCTATTFNPNSNSIGYQTYGGTGAAAAYWSGILALVVQKTGERQGLVNPTLYNLFTAENLTNCNSNVVAAGTGCVFNDISTPVTNGMACTPKSSSDCYVDPNSTVPGEETVYGILAGYTAGVGYDQTTGLGSVNVANLVNKWSSAALPSPPSSSVAMGSLVDYLGDGRSDFSIWRPSSANFYIMNQQEGSLSVKQWGLSSDVPVIGDFDGDWVTDFAVWRPSNGTWYITDSSTGQLVTKQWGATGDIPVVGDFDGDQKTDIAVWRPSNGTWYVSLSSTNQVLTKQWGLPTDVPVSGDFDGDGKTDIAVWRPSNGTWYITLSSTGQLVTKQWGLPTDVPVFGDFDGDGKTDIAIWRPSNGTWYIIDSSTGQTTVQQWGESGDVPAASDYNGSGKSSIAVWRPANGTWYVNQGGQSLAQQWGVATDLPMEQKSGH